MGCGQLKVRANKAGSPTLISENGNSELAYIESPRSSLPLSLRQGTYGHTNTASSDRLGDVHFPHTLARQLPSCVHWLCMRETADIHAHPLLVASAGHSAALIRSCISHPLRLQISFEYYAHKLQLARCRLYIAPREIRPPKSGSCTMARGARTVRLGAFEKAARPLLSHLPTLGTAWCTVASWSREKTVALVNAALRPSKHACSRDSSMTFLRLQ